MKKTVSKGRRILRNVALILLILTLVDFLAGTAHWFPELQFRREERGSLLGPSRILGTEEIHLRLFDTMIIADAGDGVILWLSGEDIGRTQLIYREKYTDHMIVVGTGHYGYSFQDEVHIPLVLFDSEPRAARAEITFTVDEVVNGEYYEKTYQLESERTAQGYFLFTIDEVAKGAVGLQAEGAALQIFANISANLETNPQYIVPVQIRFFDVLGNLIGEATTLVRSEASLYIEEKGIPDPS